MPTPYYRDDAVTLYLGDCVEVMATLDAQSVTTVVTDPPYSSGGRRENARSLRTSMVRRLENDEWIHGDHPTEKPLALLDLLLSVVAPPGAVVLDSFAGVGTTLQAAKARGLCGVGIESDERFAEVAAYRLERTERNPE